MQVLLALHIIFIVTWFAGLFYIVRLFIYTTEANSLAEPDRTILLNQYAIMRRRLWYGITWPSAVATFILGPWILFQYRLGFLSQAFFLLKLAFVFGLAMYHLQCHVIFKQLKAGVYKRSSMWLRMWNEVASILLVAIVFIIELKDNSSNMWIAVGVVMFAAALYLGIQLYKKSRMREINPEQARSSTPEKK